MHNHTLRQNKHKNNLTIFGAQQSNDLYVCICQAVEANKPSIT